MLTWRNRLVLALLLFVVLTQVRPASAQTADGAFQADLDKLLEVTGSAKIGQQTASVISGQILDALRKKKPDIPERAIEIAKDVLDSEFAKAFEGPDGLNAQVASIYRKHFSADDVKGLLAFYNTDLGKKTIAVMPLVIQEAAVAGQAWAEKHMPRITETLQARLRQEGLIK